METATQRRHTCRLCLFTEHDNIIDLAYHNRMNFPLEIKQKCRTIAAQIGLNPKDVEEHFARGSGHGGQNLNKSTNCVELHHAPSGISVRYQHHRGLKQNRKEAWELLILKVQEQVTGKESELGNKRHKIEKQKQRRSRRAKMKILDDKTFRADLKATRKPTNPELEF